MAAPLGLLRPSRSAPRPQVALLPPAGQLKRGRAGAAALVEDVLSADLGTPGVLSLAQGCMSPHFLGRFVEAAQRTPEGAAFVALAHRYVPDIAALLTGRTLMQLYHYYPCSMFGSPPSADQVAGIVASAIRHARGAPWAIALAAAARAFCTAASTSEQEAPSEMLRGAFYASLRIGGNAPAPVREELKPPGKSIAATVRTLVSRARSVVAEHVVAAASRISLTLILADVDGGDLDTSLAAITPLLTNVGDIVVTGLPWSRAIADVVVELSYDSSAETRKNWLEPHGVIPCIPFSQLQRLSVDRGGPLSHDDFRVVVARMVSQGISSFCRDENGDIFDANATMSVRGFVQNSVLLLTLFYAHPEKASFWGCLPRLPHDDHRSAADERAARSAPVKEMLRSFNPAYLAVAAMHWTKLGDRLPTVEGRYPEKPVNLSSGHDMAPFFAAPPPGTPTKTAEFLAARRPLHAVAQVGCTVMVPFADPANVLALYQLGSMSTLSSVPNLPEDVIGFAAAGRAIAPPATAAARPAAPAASAGAAARPAAPTASAGAAARPAAPGALAGAAARPAAPGASAGAAARPAAPASTAARPALPVVAAHQARQQGGVPAAPKQRAPGLTSDWEEFDGFDGEDGSGHSGSLSLSALPIAARGGQHRSEVRTATLEAAAAQAASSMVSALASDVGEGATSSSTQLAGEALMSIRGASGPATFAPAPLRSLPSAAPPSLLSRAPHERAELSSLFQPVALLQSDRGGCDASSPRHDVFDFPGDDEHYEDAYYQPGGAHDRARDDSTGSVSPTTAAFEAVMTNLSDSDRRGVAAAASAASAAAVAAKSAAFEAFLRENPFRGDDDDDEGRADHSARQQRRFILGGSAVPESDTPEFWAHCMAIRKELSSKYMGSAAPAALARGRRRW